MGEIKLNSYAKINLSLYVTGRRSDGYHDISSFMQGINLFDTLCLKTIIPKKYDFYCFAHDTGIYLCTNNNTIPLNMSNLALRGIAAVLGESAAARVSEMPYLTINLEKKLPVAAGIAGGSGNAAVSMLGVNNLLGNPLSLTELMKLGARVGADVPFSILMNAYRNRDTLEGLAGLEKASEAAIVEGIGDIVNLVPERPYYVLVFNPGISVSTKEVYEAIDKSLEGRKNGQIPASSDDKSVDSAINKPDNYKFHNDLELYTLSQYDEAKKLENLMRENLKADYVLMSGSGPTIVAYYTDKNCIENDFRAVQNAKWMDANWRVWKTRSGGSDVWN